MYTTIDLRKQMGEILDRTRIAGEPAAITRKGKTLAYLVPADWFEHYQQLTQPEAAEPGPVPPAAADDSADAA
ncbi:type II toxin-antitoxin system prevent-host-death family antitoxin [Streptomyces sp. NPDC012825]|uniref:type II toxin-antitoxin system prevent-host-death family antitoxin n=1 Tax=Streptomyces sp. NPDC012825 TaxID=3364851 RepID=UPI0036BF9872